MNSTVWVLEEQEEEESRDHNLLLANEEILNKLTKEMGIKELKYFLDYSSEQEEFGLACQPAFFSAHDLESYISMLLDGVREASSDFFIHKVGLIEELHDCLFKIRTAKAN